MPQNHVLIIVWFPINAVHEQNEKASDICTGSYEHTDSCKIVATPDKPCINLLHSQNSVNDIDLWPASEGVILILLDFFRCIRRYPFYILIPNCYDYLYINEKWLAAYRLQSCPVSLDYMFMMKLGQCWRHGLFKFHRVSLFLSLFLSFFLSFFLSLFLQIQHRMHWVLIFCLDKSQQNIENKASAAGLFILYITLINRKWCMYPDRTGVYLQWSPS